MRTQAFKLLVVLSLGLLASGVLGCDIFLPGKGGEGQPCLDNGTCDEGLTCTAENVCREGCTDTCPAANETRCQGTWVERCTTRGGCLAWVQVQDCSTLGDQVCRIDAGGAASCVPECDPAWACTTEGTERCKPQVTIVQTCTRVSATCLQWQDTESCVAPQYCAALGGGDYGCTGGCSECGPTGARRCENTVLQECTDVASCLRWVDLQDCAASGQFCDDTLVPPACVGTCTPNCPAQGDLRCNADRIERCDNSAGCLIWVVVQDCTATSQTCDDSGGTPTCTGGCTNECMSGEERCSDNWRQDCQPGADTCFHFQDLENCAAIGKACNTIAGVPPTTTCGDTCAPTCQLATDTFRCTALRLEACLEVGGFPGCYQWQTYACTAATDCASCSDGSFNVLCESGACQCAIPCGLDGRTCCEPAEVCNPTSHACEACVPLGDPCTGSSPFCCGDGTCNPTTGLCELCTTPGMICGDACCGPSQYCHGNVCEECAVGAACGDKCCPPDQICEDRATGSCRLCTGAGEVPCMDVCCDTNAGQFCLSPGQCGLCTNLVCNPGGSATCCPPTADVCSAFDNSCCEQACLGLPCGPDPACGRDCGQSCQLSTWSITAGGSSFEAEWDPGPALAVDTSNTLHVLTYSSSLPGVPLWYFKADDLGAISSETEFGGNGDEFSGVIRQTSDNGQIIAASTSSWTTTDGNDMFNFWLISLASDGTIAWQKVYGTPDADRAFDVREITTGTVRYVVAGDVEYISPQLSGLILQVGPAGGLLGNTMVYDPSGANLSFRSIAPLVYNGNLLGVVAVGFYQVDAAPAQILAMRLDASLDAATWTQLVGGLFPGIAQSVAATADGAFVYVAGHVDDPVGDRWRDGWLAKIDASNGSIVWQRVYGASYSNEFFNSVRPVSTGGSLLVAGGTDGPGATGLDGWLLEIRENDGMIVWQRRYGSPGGANADEVLYDLQRYRTSPLGPGYVAVGKRTPAGAPPPAPMDVWLLKLDEAGDVRNCATVEAAFTSVSPIDPNLTVNTCTFNVIVHNDLDSGDSTASAVAADLPGTGPCE